MKILMYVVVLDIANEIPIKIMCSTLVIHKYYNISWDFTFHGQVMGIYGSLVGKLSHYRNFNLIKINYLP